MSETPDDFDLDLDLDEVADLIGFINPPDGIHIYGVVFCGKDRCGGEGSPKGIKLIYQKIATVEKANEEDLDAPNGSVFQESFTGNKMGQELLKLRLKQIYGSGYTGGALRPYVETLGEKKMSEFHLQLGTKINIGQGKGVNKGKTYENVRIQTLVPVDMVELPEKWDQYEHKPNLED